MFVEYAVNDDERPKGPLYNNNVRCVWCLCCLAAWQRLQVAENAIACPL